MEETHRRPRVKIPSYERERERERERDMYESNAWAQQEQSYTHATQETTQVKDDVEGYEELAALNLPKPRVHIPPATPLPYTSQQTRNQKARAITDPPRGSAAPKPLFAG
ncbi:MAG: hypothetical protein M1830_007795, partial [Pleopsidium flavum]